MISFLILWANPIQLLRSVTLTCLNLAVVPTYKFRRKRVIPLINPDVGSVDLRKILYFGLLNASDLPLGLGGTPVKISWLIWAKYSLDARLYQ